MHGRRVPCQPGYLIDTSIQKEEGVAGGGRGDKVRWWVVRLHAHHHRHRPGFGIGNYKSIRSPGPDAYPRAQPGAGRPTLPCPEPIDGQRPFAWGHARAIRVVFGARSACGCFTVVFCGSSAGGPSRGQPLRLAVQFCTPPRGGSEPQRLKRSARHVVIARLGL